MKYSFPLARYVRELLATGYGNSMRIGLLDHMGYGNLGDAAIQEAVIAGIRKRLPDVQLIGFSLVPDDTTRRHGIPCYPILRWHPSLQSEREQSEKSNSPRLGLKAALKSTPIIYRWAKPALEFVREIVFWLRSYRALRGLDLLIISGGGQLGELWRGPWAHPFTIFKFSVLAKLAGKKLYFLNVGAGPLKHPLSRFFVRCAVQLADYRSFRDVDSEKLIRSLGIRGRTYVYPDPAYALAIEDPLRNVSGGDQLPMVGLNPIGFCDPRIWPRQNVSLYDAYLEKLAGFSVWLLEHGYALRVFSTEISVDRYAIEDLRNRLLSKLPAELVDRVFHSASPGVREVLREMMQFDYIVTSKFHGVIFSHLLRKPVVALSYHRKMDMAMRALGQSHFCADIEHFEVDYLTRTFRLLVDDSAKIKLASREAVEVYSSALSEQFDDLFLSHIKIGQRNSRSGKVAARELEPIQLN